MLAAICLLISILLSVAATIAYKTYSEKGKFQYNFAVAQFLMFFVVFFNAPQIIAQVQDWLLSGTNSSEEYYVQPDEDSGGGYYTSYSFTPNSKVNPLFGEFIKLGVLIIISAGFCWTAFLSAKKENKPVKEENGNWELFIKLLISIMLIVCLLPMPYWYYNVVRFFCTLWSVSIAFGYIQKLNLSWMVFYMIIANLFNPFIPIYLEKLTWNVIDVLLASILLLTSGKQYIDSRTAID